VPADRPLTVTLPEDNGLPSASRTEPVTFFDWETPVNAERIVAASNQILNNADFMQRNFVGLEYLS